MQKRTLVSISVFVILTAAGLTIRAFQPGGIFGTPEHTYYQKDLVGPSVGRKPASADSNPDARQVNRGNQASQPLVKRYRLNSDRFANDKVISRWQSQPLPDGRIRRVRVYKTRHRHPLVRVEQIIKKDETGATGSQDKKGSGEVVLRERIAVADQIVVKLRRSSNRAEFEDFLSNRGAKILKDLRGSDYVVVSFTDVSDENFRSLMDEIKGNDAVEHAEDNPMFFAN